MSRVFRLLAASLVTFLVATLGLVLGSGSAGAEPPFRVPTQISDTIDVLDADERQDLETAIDALFENQDIRLWVVFVSDFAGVPSETWGVQTAQLSEFGNTDVLMAVATEDRAYRLDVPQALDTISDAEIRALEQDSIEPLLNEGNWGAAAVSAANGLEQASATSSSDSGGLWVAVLVIAAVIGGAVVYTRVRTRRRREDAVRVAEQVDGTDEAAIARIPLDILDDKARSTLVETDEAVRSSAEELSAARDELGDAGARPFVDALTESKAALAQAFSLRHQLDDAVPESPDDRRRMLTEILRLCTDADARLDEKVEEFDAIRDLLINSEARLDALTRNQVELTARIEKSATTLAGLQSRFPSSVLEPIERNVDLAREQLELADENIDLGRDAAAAPVGRQGPVVAAVRTAESALADARSLLDGIDHAESDIGAAVSQLPAALEDARSDVAAADRLAQHGGDELATARTATAEALTYAEANGETDPLGSMNGLVAADALLDAALAAATSTKEQDDHARARLDRDLLQAASQVRAASDFIDTRRGAVKAEARTRLAEAERHLDAAQKLAPTDAPRALQHAAAATALAARSAHQAQADVSDWEERQRPQQPGGFGGGSAAGGILAGVLIDSVLRSGGGGFGGGLGGGRRYGGNRGGGGFGGFGGGPRSFGGSGSSGRIGRSSGGRF